ncbi:MBL fold metallo-hydrolase [Streptomyces oceani]|uniref:MBL fold metallo-hydrolase n=1 Tax=Streptomyces oceani TaxID=1075402 RepID=UPI0009A11DC5|nr:MBL fold metallo-hydrolase [Streptomyces oceani]
MSGLPRPTSFGAEPVGERRERILRSPHFDRTTGEFRNPVAARTVPAPETSRLRMARELLSRAGRRPAPGAIPVSRPELTTSPVSGLRLTWLGHSSVLAEIDGRRVLFDPVWGERCSPFPFVGPRRFHPAPLSLDQLDQLGPLDAVVISHDHYDHLDLPSVRALARREVTFAVPLGVGAHLERWGVAQDAVRELDWHESARIAGLELTAAPARHFCGRGLRNRQRTLWASWVVAGPEHRIFHSGDTGYFPGFADTGAAYGPFDATMIQVGAYSVYWPDIHMTPEEGVQTHLDLSGGALLPIHWGTFNLAPHPWREPADRMVTAAEAARVRLAVPAPGEPFEPAGRLPVTPWWREAASPAAERSEHGGPTRGSIQTSADGFVVEQPARRSAAPDAPGQCH